MERKITNNLIMVMVTLICPPAGGVLALICLYRSNKNWKVCILCVAYALAIFAYCYEPTVDSDLVRYRQIMQEVQNMSFFDAVNHTLYGEGNLYVFMGICWILGKMGQPNLLQAVSIFFVYYISGYINYTVAKDNGASSKECFVSFAFLLMNASFYTLTNNVRNIFAFCIIVYAVFRDVYLNKKDFLTVILYVAPCFMHATAILLVLFRFIVSITGKIKWILLVLVVTMKILVEYLLVWFSALGGSNILFELIKSMLIKGNRYYNNYDSAWAMAAYNSGSMMLMKLIVVIMCVIITLFLFKVTRTDRNGMLQGFFFDQVKKRTKFIDYLFLIDIMGFACVPMHMPEYWRFHVIIILFNGVILCSKGDEFDKRGFWRLLRKGLFVISPAYFVLCFRDLLLYSKPLSMFINSFLCNPITMFFIGESGFNSGFF